MIDFENGLELMDRPEIISRLFFPRREFIEGQNPPNVMNYFIKVAEDISIGCRFYPARNNAPNILYFHGNGETCLDYDYIDPLYRERGLNLFVADYRGYGFSDGNPSCSSMIRDAHPTFQGFVAILHDLGYNGDLFVMGRSMGSAPAIEVAYHYQRQLKGLIVESGFASSRNQFARLGVTHLFKDVENPVGFGNDLKIREVVIPTLIIHGEEDEIIPAEEGRALYALSGAAEKVSLFIPHAGHNDLMVEGLEEYMGAIESHCKIFKT
ncbi:MAG: alpha/beta hydrolase [Proteobacteria bacterium]|nr:alpha/beta hydrolase [Pseudomonadota bacterium]